MLGASLFQGVGAEASTLHADPTMSSAAEAPDTLPPKTIRPHTCAVFGPTTISNCDSYPTWSSGFWTPPEGVHKVHVLVIGGGGGGGASMDNGFGGNGGSSGEVHEEFLALTGPRVLVHVGAGGEGGTAARLPGVNGELSLFGTMTPDSRMEPGTIRSEGGQGGRGDAGGQTPSAGINGGGGAGAGLDGPGHGGQGGDGGTGGTEGMQGEPIQGNGAPRGMPGAPGGPMPPLGFTQVEVLDGDGGIGGLFGTPQGGGGGGGGGGVQVGSSIPEAEPGDGGISASAQGGTGGQGFGAGGGGAGHNGVGVAGGAGLTGLVYVEWGQDALADAGTR